MIDVMHIAAIIINTFFIVLWFLCDCFVIIKRYNSFVIILEFDSCREFHRERTEIAATHVLAVIFASFLLGNQLRATNGTLGTLLVEDIDDTHAKAQLLVHIPVDSAESLPVTIEIESLLKVGIGLTEVTEANQAFRFLVMSYLGSNSIRT